MSDYAIKVENLSKSYTLKHQQGERYTALRDVMSNGVKNIGNRLLGRTDATRNSQFATEEQFWALNDVSFEVKQGERVGIIGRNGAGKSTLLKILSRITEPTKGRVHIKGRVASLLEVGTGFHPELTGRENIYLNGAILGMTREEIRRKFDEIVAFAEVEKFLDTPVKRYSSGMYVRLAFAVAAHLEPEILVVDEVLAVGDAAFQKKSLGKMEQVSNEGRTLLFVSHNMTAVNGLCTRAILLNTGKTALDGTASTVVQKYLNILDTQASSVGIMERRDRTGNGSIKISAIYFGTQQDPHLGYWICGANSIVRLKYVCSRNNVKHSNIEVAVGIRKLDQSRLLYLGTKVVQQDIPVVQGQGYFVCLITKLPVEPGRYSLVTEVKQNGIIVDHLEAAASVNVAEGDYYGTGILWPYGGTLCSYSWKHQSLDNEFCDELMDNER